jgi:exosortase/archaeosortase family protein
MVKFKKNYFKNFILRYLILVLSALPGLYIFYWIFTPLTVYPVYWILSIFYNTSLNGTTIFLDSIPLEIVGPCVAGSAYFLLLILNLSVPNLSCKKRINSLLFSFGILLVLNITRIIVLGILYVNDVSSFALIHKILWYLGSTIFVIGIWFLEVKKFKIKGIPFYTDFKILLKQIKKK